MHDQRYMYGWVLVDQIMIRIINALSKSLLHPSTFSFCAKATENKSAKIVQLFTDKGLDDNKQRPITNGRSWKASQLRLKSTEDLHKLWYVCVRQKNLVLADELAMQHDSTYVRKGGKIRRVEKLDQTMSRILCVIHERERIRKEYRKQLELEYVERKRKELEQAVAGKSQFPEITQEMLRAKYEALRKGKDNTEYLERIWKQKEEIQQRNLRAEQRSQKLDPSKEFSSFWEYEMTIGQRPTQQQILKAHIKNWKSLNLKQRKILLGFLNARRSKDAKSTFVKELRILGQKIAEQELKGRADVDSKVV